MLLGQVQRVDDPGLLLGGFLDGNDVVGLDGGGGDVQDGTVDQDGAVRDQLTCLGAGGSQAHAVDDVVETGFQQLQQQFAGVAALAGSFGKVATELALQDAVHALDFLLLTQLQAIVAGALAAGATMLSGLGVGLGLGVEGATSALQEEIGAFAAREFRLRSGITCHFTFLCCCAALAAVSPPRASVPAGRTRWS